MSDEDSINDEELESMLAEATETLTKKLKPDYLDDFHFRELLDMRNYLICQDHLLNDVSFKLNNRKYKLNRRIKKGTIYGTH